MNRLIPLGLYLLLSCASACAKKEPKPVRTEPWLAHPVGSASPARDAGLSLSRYVLGPPSVIRFELPGRAGITRGALTRVEGELRLELTNLAQSRGQVRADLRSLTLDDKSPEQLARAQSALDVSDAGAPLWTSFELTGLDDPLPSAIDLSAAPTSGPSSRHVRGMAVGNLLLHGFRVVRRAPLEAEFAAVAPGQVPQTVVIRSRAPFVVSLETHGISVEARENRKKPGSKPAPRRPEVRVSVELYATKVE